MKIYPYGYTTSAATIHRLMQEQAHLLLIDTRLSPWSRLPSWRKSALRDAFGPRYRWVRSLGNINYKNGGPIRLADPETGLCLLYDLLLQGHDMILLCGCASYTTCHRRVIAESLTSQVPGIVIVLPEREAAHGTSQRPTKKTLAQQLCFFSETEQEATHDHLRAQ